MNTMQKKGFIKRNMHKVKKTYFCVRVRDFTALTLSLTLILTR